MEQLEVLTSLFDDLLGCCLHSPVWVPELVTDIVVWIHHAYPAWVDGPELGTDTDQLVVVRLRDDRYGLLTEMSDFTGHGCVCNSATNVYESAQSLILGIPDEDASLAVRRRLIAAGLL